MKKVKVKDLSSGRTTKAIGVEGESLRVTPIIEFVSIGQKGANGIWIKILDIKNTAIATSLIIIGSRYNNIPPSMSYLSICLSPGIRGVIERSYVYRFNNSHNGGVDILYKLDGLSLQAWIQAPNSGHISIIGTSGNCRLTSIEDLPPEDSIIL